MEQRSDAWFTARLGHFTATDFATIANGKKQTIENLCWKKAAEIITGYRKEDNFKNASMQRGVQLENEARGLFSFDTGLQVKTVGFVEMDEFVGCSPDGLTEDSGVEIKCKDDHTHLQTLLNGDNSYRWQIQGSMHVCERSSWYFVCYNPHFPIEQQLYIEKWKRDKDMISQLEDGLNHAVQRVKEILNDYETKICHTTF
jgi:hypothetical protein